MKSLAHWGWKGDEMVSRVLSGRLSELSAQRDEHLAPGRPCFLGCGHVCCWDDSFHEDQQSTCDP